MSKTIELRRLIKAELDKVGTAYYAHAPESAAFPYIVFEFSPVSYTDARDNISMSVDIWDKAIDPAEAETVADAVEQLLGFANLPTERILPTIYRESRSIDSDKDYLIQHVALNFTIQNYEV